jgi:hypothetical protein
LQAFSITEPEAGSTPEITTFAVNDGDGMW